MRRPIKSALVLPAILLAFPAVSRAQQVFTSATAYAGTFSPFGTQKSDGDSGYVNGSSSHGVTVTDQASQPDEIDGLIFNWTRSSTSTATVSASLGQLHLIAEAQSTVSPSTFTYDDDQGNPVIVNSPMTGVAFCNATGSVLDTVTVTSATLPHGTRVDLKVTTTLDCSVSSPPYGNAEAEADVFFYRQFSGTLSDDAGNTYFGYIDHRSNGGIVSNDIEQTSDILHTFVGDSFIVELDGQVSATGDANYQYPFGAASADAGNTAFFNLDPITAGAGYTTSSGLTYTSAVPEPTSLVMISLAALPLMQRRRRCR